MTKNPTKKQKLRIRIMILLGVSSIIFFLYKISDKKIIDNTFLYWLLISGFIISIITVLYEWYYYWDITVPEPAIPSKQYTVDIFTTFCAGEPYDMVVETLTAIQSITYPHQAYLCDESNDEYLKKICTTLGVHHITRTQKTNAKAGNINNALKYSTGELCVVLDPDHVPYPNFLDPIVGHFNNPEIGFVQIVQAYSNFEESLIAKGASQQTFHFYGPMMMTMNTYGTVQAIGANCTFRRTALDSIGGHAAGLAEDMNTAMHLYAKGWKSVYVPEVLARGLVPATLSAYYKQQLKWSKGVIDLWLTSFIKFFEQFSLRQKIHYLLIPFFYLTGFVSLINFLIPIISLFFNVYPLRYDFSNFFLIIFPALSSVVIIRLAVQNWVMEEKERGFHVIGGLLFIGTWWIFITGIFYSIINKKVPYIPTPKDSKDENNFWISLPNLFLFVLSITAILHGLRTDWNPYTIIMSCMSALNCMILLFIFYAGEQFKIRAFIKRIKIVNIGVKFIGRVRNISWEIRHWIYGQIRNLSLFILLIVIACVSYLYVNDLGQPLGNDKKKKKNKILYGYQLSDEKSIGLSITNFKVIQDKNKTHADVLMCDIPFNEESSLCFHSVSADSIYKNQAFPLFNWQWKIKSMNDSIVIHKIAKGHFDSYLKKFACTLRNFNKPIYLKVSIPAGNISSEKLKNTIEFKKAWVHVYQLFQQENAFNVIWLLCTNTVDDLTNSFPGFNYVDQIVINLKYEKDAYADTFTKRLDEVITHYQHSPISKMGIPVFLEIMGNHKGIEQFLLNKKNETFLKERLTDYKGLFIRDEKFTGESIAYDDNGIKNKLFNADNKIADIEDIKPKFLSNKNFSSAIDHSLFKGIRGINYTKTLTWYKNPVPLNKKEIEEDFVEMKSIGINTIKVTGPNIYDPLVLTLANSLQLKIAYSFWVPDEIDFISDKNKLQSLSASILQFIKKNRNNSNIIVWNIANTIFDELKNYYSKPELFYQRKAYLEWINALLAAIKKIDPQRPATVDIEVSKDFEATQYYFNSVSYLDAYGLVIPQDDFDTIKLNSIAKPYFISNCDVEKYALVKNKSLGVFIKRWQDQQADNIVTTGGLKDYWSRPKEQFFKLKEIWTGEKHTSDFPEIKILLPALTAEYKTVLPYQIVIKKSNNWKIPDSSFKQLKFEWYLLKTKNLTSNGSMIKKVGEGASLNLNAPMDANNYRLILMSIKDNHVLTLESKLSLPLTSQFYHTEN